MGPRLLRKDTSWRVPPLEKQRVFIKAYRMRPFPCSLGKHASSLSELLYSSATFLFKGTASKGASSGFACLRCANER